MSSTLSISFLSDVRKHQRKSSGKETLKSPVAKKTTLHENLLDLDLSTEFPIIDRMVGNLMNECKYLEQQLQEATLFPDTSAVQDYQAQNPEGASFWKDRFQKGKLNASALRYEVMTLKASYILSFYSPYRRIILTCRFLNRRFTFLGHASYMR
jgi:hypothetical protein